MSIAEVLTRMGIPCGHGSVDSPGSRRHPEIEILGDSSAQAVPFVLEFPGFVFHQVRHPLRVIGSFLGFNLFKDYRWFGPDGEFMAQHFRFTGNELADAMRYYVEWNLRCERRHRYLRYRVEDLDRDHLLRMAAAIGRTVSDEAIDRALADVPRNHHSLPAPNNPQSVTWEGLPDGPAKDALWEIAVRYGYEQERQWLRGPHFLRRSVGLVRAALDAGTHAPRHKVPK
jgi:hypothetical protein